MKISIVFDAPEIEKLDSETIEIFRDGILDSLAMARDSQPLRDRKVRIQKAD